MQRSRFIDIAKGASIILVLVTHFDWTLRQRLGYGFYFWVSMAVPVFMIATGYVNAMSLSSKQMTLKMAYHPKLILKKLLRFCIPFLFIYVIELIIRAYKGVYYSPLQIIKYFFFGGMGVHGTYYFPVLLQMVLLVPLVYFVVKKFKYGWVYCMLANLAWEIFKNTFACEAGFGYEVYRLLAFRYLFAVAIGVHMCVNREKLGAVKWFIMFVIGALYIYFTTLIDAGKFEHERILFTRWWTTCLPAIFYIAPIFLLGLKYLNNVRCTFLEKVGNASYHIFLFQILYYNYIAPILYKRMGRGLAGGYGYYLVYNGLSKGLPKLLKR